MKSHYINKKSIIIFIVLILIVLISFIVFQSFLQNNTEQDNYIDATETTVATEGNTLSITELIDAAKAIKNNLVTVLHDIKKEDLQNARKHANVVSENIRLIQVSVDKFTSASNSPIPLFQKQLNGIQQLISAADMAIDEILLPGIDLLEAHPLSSLRMEDGINTIPLLYYIDFLDSVMPRIEVLMGYANAIDLSIFDNDGEIAKYLAPANELMEFYHSEPSIFSLLKSMLGCNEDRLYLVVAQNSSEIRASGGFPGSIGTIRIQSGILTMGDFKTVYSVLSSTTPNNIQITSEEYRLFNYLSGMQAPRDADLCPDFDRVAHIWASGYEAKNKEPVAGIISMTPHIVQRLLGVIGGEITLSDGTTLNSENATKVLQYDLYFKYFSKNSVSNGGKISDQLFAEAARNLMSKLTSNLSASNILDFLTVATESAADRTLMVWMKDSAEQAFISHIDWDGSLNTDPKNPEAGVYYNCTIASKMGWFLLIDTQVGERIKNEDNSYTYPISITFTNTITQEEITSASGYIVGGCGGSIHGAAYFFAPAGGTVENFQVSSGHKVADETYHDLKLGFIRQFFVRPGESVTITYTVTTAPGVSTPLVISQTPTAQQA